MKKKKPVKRKSKRKMSVRDYVNVCFPPLVLSGKPITNAKGLGLRKQTFLERRRAGCASDAVEHMEGFPDPPLPRRGVKKGNTPNTRSRTSPRRFKTIGLGEREERLDRMLDNLQRSHSE
jgi:hypothetical protein